MSLRLQSQQQQALSPPRVSWQDTTRITKNDNSIFLDGNNNDNNSNNQQDDWKLIHVFRGMQHMNHLEMLTPMAQAHQDELVAGLLRHKPQGYFVDLAAHDATYLSNTFALEQKLPHWTGICIEANAEYWKRLAHRNCHVVAAVVGQVDNQEITFRTGHDGALGGIEHVDFDNKPRVVRGARNHNKDDGSTKMYTVTLEHVLQRLQAPHTMDYLSLDIEGAEFFVLETFPFHRYKFHLMTVERPKPNLVQLLTKHGYQQLCKISTFGETLWAHEESKPLLDLSVLDQPGMCFWTKTNPTPCILRPN